LVKKRNMASSECVATSMVSATLRTVGSGECWKCKKVGHYARDCPDSTRDSEDSSRMECNICASADHFSRVCPQAECVHCKEAQLCDIVKDILPKTSGGSKLRRQCFSRRFILFAPRKYLKDPLKADIFVLKHERRCLFEGWRGVW